jgi:predicted ATPase/DNA-binding winged helix-turn-helix (wHTH) protein
VDQLSANKGARVLKRRLNVLKLGRFKHTRGTGASTVQRRSNEKSMTTDYAVGSFQVSPAERCVYSLGRPVALGARAFDLLLTLIQHRDRVVGKDELLALVWPGLVVEEGNLAVQVSTLRKLFGSDAIATIPARGYRFTAPVVEALPRAVAAMLQVPDVLKVPEASGGEAAPLDARQQDYERLMQKLRRRADPQHVQPADTGGWVPAALTPLLGREAALQATLQLLQSTRCLTLTGAGGSGKTRLALALAEALRIQNPGVWWVELDKLSDPKMLAAAVAQAMGISDPHKPALQAMTEQLQGRKILLVLDNCEHLVEACAELAVQLLRALPLLRLLTTSRESLRIAGEVAWPVPPLDVPNATSESIAADATTASQLGWDKLLQHASVQLLVQRIRQHNPHFAVTQNNAASLVQICRGLEGLPLALELVAAQVGPLTLAQVAARLDHSLSLMNVGARGGLPHHQTMTAAVDWGYQLLTPLEQALFVRLSVFVGGWTTESAAAVCQNSDIEADEVGPLLGRLQRVSMVLTDAADGTVRYRMLEPIRQFAFSKLKALGQSDGVKAQLLDWFVDRCKAVATELTGPKAAAGCEFLTSEFNNLRALLKWSQLSHLEQGLRLAADLWRFWQVKGHAKEMLSWFEAALPMVLSTDVEVSKQVQASAFNAAGVMARTCGLYAAAVRLHQAGLALQREQGNRRGEAIALNNLAVVARDQYDHPAVEQHGRASLALAREIGDKNLEGLGLMHLGTALRGQGKTADAEASFKQSFQIFSELGEKRALGALLNFLGNLAQADGRWLEAERCYQESLQLNQDLDDFWGLGISTCNLASLKFEQHDHQAALLLLMRSFTHYRQAGVKHGLDECFELLARIAQQRGHTERAAWCWGVLEKLEQDMAKVLPASVKSQREHVMSTLATQMPNGLFRIALEAGHSESLEDAYRAVLVQGELFV